MSFEPNCTVSDSANILIQAINSLSDGSLIEKIKCFADAPISCEDWVKAELFYYFKKNNFDPRDRPRLSKWKYADISFVSTEMDSSNDRSLIELKIWHYGTFLKYAQNTAFDIMKLHAAENYRENYLVILALLNEGGIDTEWELYRTRIVSHLDKYYAVKPHLNRAQLIVDSVDWTSGPLGLLIYSV